LNSFYFNACICYKSCNLNDIKIGTILHPQCKILAAGGPIIFGQNNIVEENVTIVNKYTIFYFFSFFFFYFERLN